jgi:hypothetical protein
VNQGPQGQAPQPQGQGPQGQAPQPQGQGPQGQAPQPIADGEKAEAKVIVGGLIGSIYADSSLDEATQKSKIDDVLAKYSSALGPGGPASPADENDPQLAWEELQAMDRAAEIPSLDNAAKILTGVTALVTGLFVGIGFTTGDFVHMIRDFQWKGITFLILVSLALLLGTFAFVVNAYRSLRNLRLERGAVYLGIVCAGTAFILASWGLAQGSSAAQTRPVISASFNTSSGTPVLDVSASSSNVPRSEHLTVIVWGDTAQGWNVLSSLVTGPTPDGTDNASITVNNNVSTYTEIRVHAFLSSADIPPSSRPHECSSYTSCFRLVGLAAPSPSPSVTPSPSPSVTPSPSPSVTPSPTPSATPS